MPKEIKTPIINALKQYTTDHTIRFHMPGHKGREVSHPALLDLLGSEVFAADVTNVPGMDDLHQVHGVIKEAQQLAAEAYGADYTYFLINGSSCGLQALILATCNPGDKILVPRNMHRSILSGIILSGAIPVYYLPEYEHSFDIALGTTPETINHYLNLHPDIKAVMLINPTYHGITSNIPAIAEIVHRRNIPLLIDEAHGSHLRFHQDLPQSALAGGADATVHGTHKMLPAFTQASMLHTKGTRINRERLEATLRILQSTSTSYLLLASLDGARAQMVEQGNTLLQKSLDMANYLRNSINELADYSVLGKEILGQPGAHGLDQTKVTISTKNIGITGTKAEKWLRQRHHIQVEMSSIYNLLLIVGAGNNIGDIDCFLSALQQLKDWVQENNFTAKDLITIHPVGTIPKMALSPREAFAATIIPLPLEQAVGRISAETIASYPPGIPVICPGEVITKEVVEYLLVIRELGMHFQGCIDAKLQLIRVIV